MPLCFAGSLTMTMNKNMPLYRLLATLKAKQYWKKERNMVVSANIAPKYFLHKLNPIECQPCKNVWDRPSWPTVNIIQKRQIDLWTIYVSLESPQHFHVTCLFSLPFLCFSYQTLKVILDHFFHLRSSMYHIIRSRKLWFWGEIPVNTS